ncbi:hypothetical protein AgCh_017112 [Apium graveolens]
MAVYCEVERVGDALRVWEEMGMKGLERDLVAYNTIIGGFCKVGEVKRDEEFFWRDRVKWGQWKGFRPENFTVDEVINGLCGKNTVSEALEYLMVAVKKLDIVPKGTSYEFCFKCAVFLFHQSKEDPLFEHPVCAELPRVIEDQPWPGKMLLAYKRSDPLKLFQCDGCEVLCNESIRKERTYKHKWDPHPLDLIYDAGMVEEHEHEFDWVVWSRKHVKQEKRIGKFNMKLVFLENANFETVKAVYQDNVLTVPVDKLPLPEPKKPKIMEVKIS